MQAVYSLSNTRNLSFSVLEDNYLKSIIINLCYSFIRSKLYFNKIIFFGDNFFIDIVRKLGLSFDEIYEIEETIDSKEIFWAFPKIYSMTKVNEPSIFVDYDVMFLKDPKEIKTFTKLDIGCQEVECCVAVEEYREYYRFIQNNIEQFSSIKELYEQKDIFDNLAFNTGVLYFKTPEICNDYAKKAIEIMKISNAITNNNYSKIHNSHVTMMIGNEQWWLKKYSDYHGLIYSIIKEERNEDVFGYVHTQGKKNDPYVLYKILKRIKNENKVLYKNLKKFLKLAQSRAKP